MLDSIGVTMSDFGCSILNTITGYSNSRPLEAEFEIGGLWVTQIPTYTWFRLKASTPKGLVDPPPTTRVLVGSTTLGSRWAWGRAEMTTAHT